VGVGVGFWLRMRGASVDVARSAVLCSALYSTESRLSINRQAVVPRSTQSPTNPDQPQPTPTKPLTNPDQPQPTPTNPPTNPNQPQPTTPHTNRSAPRRRPPSSRRSRRGPTPSLRTARGSSPAWSRASAARAPRRAGSGSRGRRIPPGLPGGAVGVFMSSFVVLSFVM